MGRVGRLSQERKLERTNGVRVRGGEGCRNGSAGEGGKQGKVSQRFGIKGLRGGWGGVRATRRGLGLAVERMGRARWRGGGMGLSVKVARVGMTGWNWVGYVIYFVRDLLVWPPVNGLGGVTWGDGGRTGGGFGFSRRATHCGVGGQDPVIHKSWDRPSGDTWRQHKGTAHSAGAKKP